MRMKLLLRQCFHWRHVRFTAFTAASFKLPNISVTQGSSTAFSAESRGLFETSSTKHAWASVWYKYIYNIEGSKGVDYIHAFLVHRFLQVFRTHFLWINMFKAFSITQVVSSYEHWSCFDCCCQTKKVVRIPTINDEVSNITFFGFAMHTHCRTFPVDV